jgi:hypothetical protein
VVVLPLRDGKSYREDLQMTGEDRKVTSKNTRDVLVLGIVVIIAIGAMFLIGTLWH